MKIAFLTIHGIGQQKPDYAEDFHIDLLSRFKTDGVLTNDIKCFELEWQHLVEPRQEILAGKLDTLKWKITRGFALTFVGDAVAYAKDSAFYRSVHTEIDGKLQEINDWLENDGQLYIVAHSLGTIIIFDYIYNIQNINALGNKVFKATSVNIMDKLTTVFTFGSPLYIYSLQKYLGGRPIKVKNWLNVYSKFDVIGYPVKTINEDYNKCEYITDKSIICGTLLTFWNPSSHIEYLNSSKVLSIITSEVYKNNGKRY
jgi:hypothetical protein